MSDKVHHPHSESEYNSLKSTENKLVVVDFSATWCGPCKMIAPTYSEYSNTYTNVVFVHVDVDELDNIEDNKDVKGVPTFKFFKNGALLDSFSGASKEKLKNLIETHK